MSTRELPLEFDVSKYVEGFLHDRAIRAVELNYGYHANHLPETSGRSREMESVFDIAKSTDSSK